MSSEFRVSLPKKLSFSAHSSPWLFSAVAHSLLPLLPANYNFPLAP